MRSAICLTAMLAVAAPAAAGSLFNQAAAQRGTLISEKQQRFEAGDIITVMVQETLDASAQADTNTRRQGGVTSQAREERNQFLVAERPDGLGLLRPQQLPNWDIDVDNEHRTRGQTQRVNTLTTTITCTVEEVLDNGNLRIQGAKKVTINREATELKLTGLVRPRDVSPDNSVRSEQVAQAEIDLEGEGPLWNNQRRGVLSRFLDWFSPF